MKTDIAPVQAGVGWMGSEDACAALKIERATGREYTGNVRIQSFNVHKMVYAP